MKIWSGLGTPPRTYVGADVWRLIAVFPKDTVSLFISRQIYVKSKEGLWAFTHGKSRFSGLQSPLGITNGNRSHNKPLKLI